jgi:hypothetical protein
MHGQGVGIDVEPDPVGSPHPSGMDGYAVTDPFIELTHWYIEGTSLVTGPLFVKPEDIREICDGEIHLSGGSWDVKQDAREIRRLVVEKLAENRQAETMGKA